MVTVEACPPLPSNYRFWSTDVNRPNVSLLGLLSLRLPLTRLSILLHEGIGGIHSAFLTAITLPSSSLGEGLSLLFISWPHLERHR